MTPLAVAVASRGGPGPGRGRLRPHVAVLLLLASAPAQAQSRGQGPLELALHLASIDSGPFHASDVGFGGRVAWRPPGPFTLEADLTQYPADFPDGAAFSRGRWEAYFGGTAGPRLGRLRVFGKLRPGLVRFEKAPEPLACIFVVPTPVVCALQDGATLFALDFGGGVEIGVATRTLLRFDVGNRWLRFDGPVRDTRGRPRDGGFWGHDLRVTAGAGVRF